MTVCHTILDWVSIEEIEYLYFKRNNFLFSLEFQVLPFYELAIMCGLGAYWSVRGKKCSKMALKDNFEIFKSRTNKKWMNATASCQNSAIFFKSIIFYSKVIVRVWWKSAVMITQTLIQNMFHKWFFLVRYISYR